MNEELSHNIDRCIRTLQEKFRECPHNFFTESDAHSYLYYSLFRYGSRSLKIRYSSKDNKRTVLIHREYPTAFRYAQKELKRYKLEEHRGTVGHYDMVVLNPDFIKSFDIEQVVSKDNEIRKNVKFTDNPLLAAIEFKLLHSRITKHLKKEIEKDFFKLNEALKEDETLEKGQAKQAYMLIFNRWGEESAYWKNDLRNLKSQYASINIIYQPSYYKNKKLLNPIISL